MELHQQLGLTIRRLRTERGLTQEQLAHEANVDRRYMSDVEQGKRHGLSLAVIERLARVLQVSLHDLFLEIENTSARQ